MPGIIKKTVNLEPEALFDKFNNMTESEFMFLSNIESEQGKVILQQLYEDGKIEKFENRNGIIWMNKHLD